MEILNKHKWHILMPIVFSLITAVVCLIFSGVFNNQSASSHINLGKQYLSDLNYSAAVLEFSSAIEIDPNNKEARINLAQAYFQSNEVDSAVQVLEEVINEASPNIEISEALIEIYKENENYVAALGVIQNLIQYTDVEKYYDMQGEIVERLVQESHTYAAGTDQELLILQEQVFSRGSNVLGQLGTSSYLGDKEYQQEEFAFAGFEKAAQNVYTVGKTSYVVDKEGNLWAAGENRWGQQGISYGTTIPQSGWTQLTTDGTVVKVGGNTGNLLILKKDGSLWHSGGSVGQKLKRIDKFDVVIDIVNYNSYVFVHTAKGEVYQNSEKDMSAWKLVKKDVSIFCPVGNNSIAWINTNGEFYSDYLGNIPSSWSYNEKRGTYSPDFVVADMEYNGEYYILLSNEGIVYLLSQNGFINKSKIDSAILSLYSEKDKIFAELEDGSLIAWTKEEHSYSVVKE